MSLFQEIKRRIEEERNKIVFGTAYSAWFKKQGYDAMAIVEKHLNAGYAVALQELKEKGYDIPHNEIRLCEEYEETSSTNSEHITRGYFKYRIENRDVLFINTKTRIDNFPDTHVLASRALNKAISKISENDGVEVKNYDEDLIRYKDRDEVRDEITTASKIMEHAFENNIKG